MEIVASIASIAQLTGYALSLIATISETYKDIRDGPRLQRQHLEQLERLSSTVQNLAAIPTLNTSSITKHLEAIIVRIKDLSFLLERLVAQQARGPIIKYLKAFLKDNKEQHRILAVFTDLEKDKSALQLSIEGTHTKLIASIHNELTERLPYMKAAHTEMPSPCQDGQPKKAPGISQVPLSEVHMNGVPLSEVHTNGVPLSEVHMNGVPLSNGTSSSSKDSTIAKVLDSQDSIVRVIYSGADQAQPDAEQNSDSDTERYQRPQNGSQAELFMSSHRPSGHTYDSITFDGPAELVAGTIWDKKPEGEGSRKNYYKNIKGAKGSHFVAGDVHSNHFCDNFFKRKP